MIHILGLSGLLFQIGSMSTNYSNETTSSSEDLMPMFRMKTIQLINRFMCVILGIPLNLLVVTVILRSRQLWTPRNIFWLAVTLYNVLALTQASAELCIYNLYRLGDGSHQTLCKFYSAIVGCPYVLLLTGLMLATWDRYLALSRQQFYKRYASSTNVSLILFSVFVIVAGGQTAPYWLGIFPISCKLRYEWLLITVFSQGILSVICLFLQIRLYMIVRSCIRYSPPDKAATMELVPQQLSNSNSSSICIDRHKLPQDISAQRLNKLEMRAARILGVGIFPFCLVTLTICVSSMVLILFRYKGLDVLWIGFIMEAFREFLLLHLIYIPTVFIAQSREFRAAVRRFCRSRPPISAVQFG